MTHDRRLKSRRGLRGTRAVVLCSSAIGSLFVFLATFVSCHVLGGAQYDPPNHTYPVVAQRLDLALRVTWREFGLYSGGLRTYDQYEGEFGVLGALPGSLDGIHRIILAGLYLLPSFLLAAHTYERLVRRQVPRCRTCHRTLRKLPTPKCTHCGARI